MVMTSIFDAITLDRVSIGDVLGALSHALDLTEGQPPGHCLRACHIGMVISDRMGLEGDASADVFYTLLLKDLGCSSNAARICELYLADDQNFKHGFKTMGASTRAALAFVLRHTGAEEGLATRIKAITNVIADKKRILTDIFKSRCEAGAEIATVMGFSPMVAEAIEALDEHWDGQGRPNQTIGGDIPIGARIALLAQVIDVFATAHGIDAARAEVLLRRGTWFDPALVDTAVSLIDDGFLAATPVEHVEALVMAHAPAQDSWLMNEDVLDELVAGFARVIDAKSPFTHGHSARVALYTDLICARLEVSESARRWMRRAALLHDIGKLGISNRLLDKPAKLDPEELKIMKTHPALGREVLDRIDIFSPLAAVAEAHHERLDGGGYPNGISADALGWEVRVISVADVFDALSAERPYRAALPVEKVWAIMDDMAGSALDPDYLSILKQAVADTPELNF